MTPTGNTAPAATPDTTTQTTFGTTTVTAIVVMGISGCGKSTLGHNLAEATGFRFIEGDDLHPPANIAKMSAGIPLSDDDRWPWLERLTDAIETAAHQGGCIASCSALKRVYRDYIRERLTVPVLFVFPHVARDILLRRMAERPGHYMPTNLLDSQLATLEPPAPDEGVLPLDGTLPSEALTARVLRHMTGAGLTHSRPAASPTHP